MIKYSKLIKRIIFITTDFLFILLFNFCIIDYKKNIYIYINDWL